MTGVEIRSEIGTIDRQIAKLQVRRATLVVLHEANIAELRKAGAVSGKIAENGGNTVAEAAKFAGFHAPVYPAGMGVKAIVGVPVRDRPRFLSAQVTEGRE